MRKLRDRLRDGKTRKERGGDQGNKRYRTRIKKRRLKKGKLQELRIVRALESRAGEGKSGRRVEINEEQRIKEL